MILFKLEIAGWCNGSTGAFGALSLGSNPSPAVKIGYIFSQNLTF